MPLLLPYASEEFGLSLGIVGFLGSLLSFSGIILALPAGVAAMRVGAVRLLSIAVLCYSIGFLLLGCSNGLIVVLISFILGSIAFGIFHPIAFSAVAKSAYSTDLGKHIGIFAATGDIGKIAFAAVVPFIVGFTSWRITSILYGIVAFLLFIICGLFSMRKKKETIAVTPERKKIDLSLFADKRFFLANASSFIDSFANASLFMFVPFLIAFRGWNASFIGIFTSLFFIGNLLGKVIMGSLTDKIRKERLFIYCELCIFISLAILALAPSIAVVSALAIILGFFTKGTVPITSTMIAESTSKDKLESAYSINSLSTSIANTAAPAFFGVLADFHGIQTIFFACGIAALCSTIPAVMIIKGQKTN